MSASDLPLPIPTPTSAPFWEALQREELLMQHCGGCSKWVHYPRTRCPFCGSADLVWERTEPTGTLHAFTVTHRPTAPMFADEVPQTIAIVELDNGARMTTTLVGPFAVPLRVGQSVVGVFDHVTDERTLLRFRIVAY